MAIQAPEEVMHLRWTCLPALVDGNLILGMSGGGRDGTGRCCGREDAAGSMPSVDAVAADHRTHDSTAWLLPLPPGWPSCQDAAGGCRDAAAQRGMWW